MNRMRSRKLFNTIFYGRQKIIWMFMTNSAIAMVCFKYSRSDTALYDNVVF